MNDRLYEVMNTGSLSVVCPDVLDLEWDDVNPSLSVASDDLTSPSETRSFELTRATLSFVRLPASGAWRPSVCLRQKGGDWSSVLALPRPCLWVANATSESGLALSPVSSVSASAVSTSPLSALSLSSSLIRSAMTTAHHPTLMSSRMTALIG
jgi:hypothetical protein